MSASNSTPKSPRASTGASDLSLELPGPPPKYCIPEIEREGLEDVERYDTGGLHPVQIWDLVRDERFEVTHKLGQGGFGTVWLCRDNREDRWCALKIMASAQSSEEGGDVKVMNHFREKGIDPQEAAAHHVVVPEEHFWINGPNGRHLALVTPLLGPSLAYWLEEQRTTFDAMTGFCRQMAKGLQFLHDHGVCHNDFRPANILLKIRNIDSMTADEIFELFEAPDTVDISLTSGEESSPHAPEYLVKPVRWATAMEKGIVLEEIAIVDFGEAFLEGQPPAFSGIPMVYTAPEIMFNKTPSTASDVWALGASIMEVYGGRFFADATLLATQVLEKSLGPLPLEYREEFESQHRAYLTNLRAYEDLCERNLLKQGLTELINKNPPKTEPSEWALTAEQRTDPSHPVSYSPVTQPEANSQEADSEEGYSHPFTKKLSTPKFGFFKGPDPRHNEDGIWYLSRDEILALTDLASKIFLYDTQERLTAAQVLGHTWLKEETEEEGVLGLGFLQRAVESLSPILVVLPLLFGLMQFLILLFSWPCSTASIGTGYE
ncbi:hypothetical protein PG997_008564 [Apiospora hydei]|uniref:EKC/KEOPS complex subunit BUD32 n=1 Tax=Apiospora hydei TaxID=1337664 RepID=A0ABR1WB67_9PEZI